MRLACRLGSSADNPIKALSDFVDCQSSAMAHAPLTQMGHGLLVPGFSTTALTLFVALIGYRMMLGRGLSAYDLAVATMRVGVVLCLTTGWNAYDKLFYRVATLGPLELVAHVMNAPVNGTDLSQRLDSRFQTFVRRADQMTVPMQGSAASQAAVNAAQDLGDDTTGKRRTSSVTNRATDPLASQGGGVTFWDSPTRLVVLGSFGALLAMKLVIGALLGLGPIFILLALFDATLGLFVGWLRSLISSSLALSGLMISSLLQLSYFEAALAQAATSPNSTIQNLSAGTGIATFVFLLTPIFFVVAAFGAGFGLKISGQPLWRSQDWGGGQLGQVPSSDRSTYPNAMTNQQDSVARIRSINDAIDIQTRRDSQRGAAMAAGGEVGGLVSRREVENGPTVRGQGLPARRSEVTFRSPSTIRRDGR